MNLEQPPEVEEIEIDEYPKMRPIGKSDKAAEQFVLRELEELNKIRNNNAENKQNEGKDITVQHQENNNSETVSDQETIQKLNDEELNEIDLGDAVESQPQSNTE